NTVRFALLQAVAGVSEHVLQQRLSALQTAEFLYERRGTLDHTYTFKHTLTQEVAYQSLLTRTRQEIHARIAQEVAAHFPDLAETRPALLAQHYMEAGLVVQAIAYWQRAGQQALQGSANLEAVRHLTTALELLAPLSETPARAQQELDLQIALCPVLIADNAP